MRPSGRYPSPCVTQAAPRTEMARALRQGAWSLAEKAPEAPARGPATENQAGRKLQATRRRLRGLALGWAARRRLLG